MINAKRLTILTEEERNVYNKARDKIRLHKDELEDLKKEFVLLKGGLLTQVLCKCQRPSKGAIQPDYKGTDYALAGMLLKGETLDDFVIHKFCMNQIIKKRVEELWNRYMIYMQINRINERR